MSLFTAREFDGPRGHGAGCGCGLTRRGVFAGLTAAGASLAAAPAVTAAAPYRIDVHHHIMPPQFLKEGPASVESYRKNPKIGGWTKERSIEVLDQNGIAKAMLSFPQPSQWSMEVGEQRRLARLCNDFFAQVKRDVPGRFGLFAGAAAAAGHRWLPRPERSTMPIAR